MFGSRAAIVAAAVAVLARPAEAAGPRLLLDRADLEPSPFGGLARLRLHVSAVQLEGSLIQVGGADPLILTVNGARRREAHLTGRYAAADGATAVILVIETGWEMRDEVDAIGDAVKRLLSQLPPGSQVAIVTYGENVEGGHRLAASAKLQELEADGAPADPQLLAAVERAITTLARAKAPAEEAHGVIPRDRVSRSGGDRSGGGVPLRRMIVVVSDGKDLEDEPDRYRSVGERAMREEVRIHSLAYSPVDNRRPLLGLGELSKRSRGTFRWVRSREGFQSQIDTLVAEINHQYVLTWFLPADQLINKRIAISYRDLLSNEVRVKKVECGGKSCSSGQLCARGKCVGFAGGGGRGILGWLLIIGGGAVGVLVLLGVVGSLMVRARNRSGRPAVSGGAPKPGGYGPAPANAPSAVLYVNAGPFQGQRMALRHGFTVGSARGTDLFLPGDPGVAPHHAVFLVDGTGTWAIMDRSNQGVFVNGVRVAEARLSHGNLIRIGTCELRYLTG